MPRHDVLIGGLFRCCIMSVLAEAPMDAQLGDTFHCTYCGERLQLVTAPTETGYAWQWFPATEDVP